MKRSSFIFVLILSFLSQVTWAEDDKFAELRGKSHEQLLAEDEAKRNGTSGRVYTNSDRNDNRNDNVVISSPRYSKEFERLNKKTPCSSLFEKNKFEENDEVRQCRINIAKSIPGARQACTEFATVNGKLHQDNYRNCMADRGTSQVALDARKEHLDKIRRAEEKAREEGKIPSEVPVNFSYDKKNSKIRTFHFWEILKQKNVPIIHGHSKNPIIRIDSISYDYSSGERRAKSNYRGLKILNTPDEACQMLTDEEERPFHAAYSGAAIKPFIAARPDVTPFRTALRDQGKNLRDQDKKFNNGRWYEQATEFMGIGKDGEYVEAEQKRNKLYYHYIVLTCVRKLDANEEADEEQWRKELRLLSDGHDLEFNRIYSYRRGLAQEDKADEGKELGPSMYYDPTFSQTSGSRTRTNRDTSNRERATFSWE